MPCYMVNTISIEFQPQNARILEKAVQSLGWKILYAAPARKHWEIATNSGTNVVIDNGQATGRSEDVNALRVAYSQAAVAQAALWAKEKGWQVTKSSASKMTLKKGW